MENELVIIKRIYAALLGLKKNCGLYPASHPVCVNSLAQVHKLLDTFLSTHGKLRFDITKGSILFKEEVLDGGMLDEGALPVILFRDGFRWLEFVDGILPVELEQFMMIINKYSILSNEPDGDIATAFWDTCFEHIRYEVTDSFGETPQGGDLASFSQGPSPEENQAPMEQSVPVKESVKPVAIDPTAIVITAEEEIQIDEMVCNQERKATNDYLDALFDSLLSYRQQENFSVIMEVLESEFKDALARKDFDSALNILKNLEYIRTIGMSDVFWAASLIEDFFITVSQAKFLIPLQDIWPDIDAMQIEKIKAVLMLMRPEVLHTLGAILAQPQSFLLGV